MSTLTPKEKALLEKLFDMSGGYVLNFSDSTIETFFAEFDVDIHSEKYQNVGTSKAKKLREFWRIEQDELVGPVLHGLIEHVEAMDVDRYSYSPSSTEEKNEQEGRLRLIEDCKEIARRLCSAGPPLTALKQSSSIFNSQYISSQIARWKTRSTLIHLWQ